MREGRPGPGIAGMAGMLCLVLVAAAFLVTALLPAAAWVALLVAGVGLVGFATLRSLRGPA